MRRARLIAVSTVALVCVAGAVVILTLSSGSAAGNNDGSLITTSAFVPRDEARPRPKLEPAAAPVQTTTTTTARPTPTTVRPKTTTTTKPAPPKPAAPAPAAAGGSVWDRMAVCETGGNWAMQGSRFSGGLGFANSTWAAYGGLAYASNAGLATREQQIAIAEKIMPGGAHWSGPGCTGYHGW